jgi:hypothetical protein
MRLSLLVTFINNFTDYFGYLHVCMKQRGPDWMDFDEM